MKRPSSSIATGGLPPVASEHAFANVVLDRAPFGISLTSLRPESYGTFIFANPAYCKITGYSAEQLKATRPRDMVHPDDLPEALAAQDKLLSREVPETDIAMRLQRRDGAYITVRQHRTVVRDEAGAPLWFVTHTEDVTAARATEAAVDAARSVSEGALRESELRYRLLADYAPDMIICTRRDRTRSYVSPGSQKLLGYAPSEMMELDFSDMLHPDDRERVQREYEDILEQGGSGSYTYRVRRKSGDYVWVESNWVSAPTVGDGSGGQLSAVVSIVRDISERKAAESKIASMARHDVLTGLANRGLFRERLDEARALVERGGSAALFLVDLDNFKGVNDTLGHDIGDQLLQEVADRLLTCVRQSDTVARLGGDEFTVIMLGLDDRQEASRRAQHIVDVLSQRYYIAGHHILTSASVGVTTSPADGLLPEDLLKNADVALYCAKGEGRRNYRLFRPNMAVSRQKRLDTEGELRAALADETFTIYYQPIVSATSTAIVGFEALVRWQHPVRGLVFPDEFIPVAEDTGMIVELGAWVLRGACRRAATWPAGVRVSVNVSAVQIRNSEFVETVRSALAEARLPADRLDLEITESMLLDDHQGTLAVLNDLRRLGVSISLDDFGTGYSSLGQLRSFRFDHIKIDRTFIGDMLQRAESQAIVRAVVGIASELGISTVAEGVETRGQLQRLRMYGCTEAQGFLFSKARPAEDIPAMLAEFEPRRAREALLASA